MLLKLICLKYINVHLVEALGLMLSNFQDIAVKEQVGDCRLSGVVLRVEWILS